MYFLSNLIYRMKHALKVDSTFTTRRENCKILLYERLLEL